LLEICLNQYCSSSNINQHINELIAIDQGFIRYVGRYSWRAVQLQLYNSLISPITVLSYFPVEFILYLKILSIYNLKITIMVNYIVVSKIMQNIFTQCQSDYQYLTIIKRWYSKLYLKIIDAKIVRIKMNAYFAIDLFIYYLIICIDCVTIGS
jgi:hypothetical protein